MQSVKKHINIQTILKILLILVFIISVFSTYHITSNMLDGDAASELVFANHIAQTGQFLSKDWYYSTEIRIICIQLIYAPLFMLFNDWSFVRFSGAAILQLLLIGSFFFAAHKAKFDKRAIYLGCILLLLPVSVSYGRVVLYHCFYTAYISFSFLLAGLIFSFSGCKNRLSLAVKIILLAALSFDGGLNGARMLLIFNAPLLFGLVLLAFVKDCRNHENQYILNKKFLTVFAPACISLISAAAGYIVNSAVLSAEYTFNSYSNYILSLLPADLLNRMTYGFMHLFGFRENVELISAMGILSVAGAFAAIYCLSVSVIRLLNPDNSKDINYQLFQLMFVFSAIVTIAVFLLTGGAHVYHFYLYLVPVYVWAVPFIVSVVNFDAAPKQLLNLNCLLPVIVVCILVFNGFANILFFHGKAFTEQAYTGLDFENRHLTSDLSEAVAFIEENGYDLGYSTFWHCNVVTELTDGNTKMVSVTFEDSSKSVNYFNWLTLKSNRSYDAEKPFILVRRSERDTFENLNLQADISLAFKGEYYSVYDINNLEEFRSIVQ